MCARFVIYADRADRWRWRLVARNGRIIADCGSSYGRREDVEHAVERVEELAPAADRLDYGQPHFEVYVDRKENHRWRLVARNGRIIADSGQGYSSRSGAVSAIETVQEYLAEERGIETYRDDAGDWRWRLVASNGRTIADSGQGYTTQSDVGDAVDRVIRDGPIADQLETGLAHFEVFEDRAGKWRWRLIARNGRIIADSGQGYVRKNGAIRGLSRVQAACGGTPEEQLDPMPDPDPEITETTATLATDLSIEAVHPDETHRSERILEGTQPVPTTGERSDK